MTSDTGEKLVTIKIKESVRDKLRNMGTKSDTYSSLLERYCDVIRLQTGVAQVRKLDDGTYCLVAKTENYGDLLELLEPEIELIKRKVESFRRSDVE